LYIDSTYYARSITENSVNAFEVRRVKKLFDV
jgi:hypothetical protein